MQKKKLLITLILLITGSFCTFAANKSVIAVFDFKNVMNGKSNTGAAFSLLLFAELSVYDDIKMVEREELNKIMKERKLKRSGLVKNNYMEIAALINADYIVTGRIFKEEDEIIINLKLTRCSDGKIFGKSFFIEISDKKNYLEKVAAKAAAFVDQSKLLKTK
ncbi:MAG: CsgG/HfaB family protein [Victivallaceae bacterium]|nr:CsgG/HfaB family protein [Victivallaceae bacterium]